MSATIMLATNFDIEKTTFPVLVSEKMDGVPVKIFKSSKGWEAITRQGKTVTSINHILEQFDDTDPAQSAFVGELVKPNATFEETSGLVRQLGDSPELEFLIYDYFKCDENGDCIDNRFFHYRLEALIEIQNEFFARSTTIKLIHQFTCGNLSNLDDVKDMVRTCAEAVGRKGSLFEGWMIRPMHGKDSVYKQGKRSLGMMRIVPEPTVDLRVIRVMEAVDKYGNPKETIGSLVCIDKSGIELKVGAGCMDFAQRKYYWDNTSDIMGEIVVVKYKPSTYGKLRQPTFQRFHFDKTEPDTI